MPFSQRLRRLREAAGLTQEELAERAGISVKAVSALERGRRQRPYPHTVRALAEALGLSDDARAELAGSMPGRTQAVPPTRQPSSPEATSASMSTAPNAPAAPAAPAAPNVPITPTALIGRERELTDIAEMLAGTTARLVSLIGPGGVGKTRLASEVALRLHDVFDGRVRFVALAPLGDAELVLPTIAQAFGVSEAGTASVRETLTAYIGANRWLLILDNAEHVLGIASDVAELLALCPALVVLVTSRAPLKVRAEHEYPVRPLPVPDLSHIPTLDEVADVSSVRLFVERAQAANPAFVLTQANCAAVAAVCRRLDGLPLALELVAARVRFLSPTDVLARLDHLLPLLSGGPRDLPQRQQTMWAAIDWSYELLRPSEQALFRRLSVFAGGCTLDAAEDVVAWGEIASGDVIELLSGLVEQSLVVAEMNPDRGSRFSMLEPIRQFAAQQVTDVGEADTLYAQHLAWSLALTQQAALELRGPAQQFWLERLEQEHDNLRVAMAWCQQDAGRAASGLQLATSLWRFWATRGYLSEGRRWLEDGLASTADIPDDLRAEAYNAAGNLTRDQGEHEHARHLHEASLELRRRLNDTRGIAISLNNIGTILMDQGDYARATALYDEALTLFRQSAKDWDIAVALHNLGLVLGRRGEYEQSNRFTEEALAIWDRVGETGSLARSLDVLGETARRQGNLDRAASLHERSLELRREIGETRGIAITLRNLGLVTSYRGDVVRAQRLLTESLELHQRVGDKRGMALTLTALAGVARQQGDAVHALDLYRNAVAMHEDLQIREELPVCLLGIAAIVADTDPRLAARLLGASNALRESMAQALPVADHSDVERMTSSIQRELPEPEFQHLYNDGRTTPLEDIITVVISDARASITRHP